MVVCERGGCAHVEVLDSLRRVPRYPLRTRDLGKHCGFLLSHLEEFLALCEHLLLEDCPGWDGTGMG